MRETPQSTDPSQAPVSYGPILDFAKKLSNLQLVLLNVLIVEVLVGLLDLGVSLYVYGEIKARPMLSGALVSFFASLTIGSFMVYVLTALRRAEVQSLKALITERQRARAIMDTSPLGIYITEPEGKVLTASPGHEVIFATGSLEATGRPLWDLLSEGAARAELKGLFEGLAKEGSATTLGRTIKSGTADLRVTCTRIIGPSGDTLGFCAALEDVTERRVLSERLTASRAEREALYRELHQRVKGNIAIVSSLLSLQARTSSEAEARSTLLIAQGRLKAMALVYDALHQSGDLASINMKTYMESLVAAMKSSSAAPADKTILWNTDVDEVVVDIDTLVPCGMALNELMTNSLKHAFRDRAWGQVSLVLRRTPEGGINILYHDNGSGLPEGLDWRASSGLGLKLVSGFVTQLGGTLDLAPVREGLGFNIMIPAPR